MKPFFAMSCKKKVLVKTRKQFLGGHEWNVNLLSIRVFTFSNGLNVFKKLDSLSLVNDVLIKMVGEFWELLKTVSGRIWSPVRPGSTPKPSVGPGHLVSLY